VFTKALLLSVLCILQFLLSFHQSTFLNIHSILYARVPVYREGQNIWAVLFYLELITVRIATSVSGYKRHKLPVIYRKQFFCSLRDTVIFRIPYLKYLILDESEENVTMLCNYSRDTSVRIAMGCEMKVGARFPAETSLFSSPQRPDRLWGPPSLLSNGYLALFLPG
jgi:hypothetical protein